MKNAIVLLFCLLIVKSGLCQNGYPKSILLDDKKVVLITQSQAKALNLLWSSYSESIEINSELTGQISNYIKLIDLYEFTIGNKDSIISVQSDRIKERDELLTSYKSNENKLDRKIKWLKTSRTIIGILFISSLGYITYNSIK